MYQHHKDSINNLIEIYRNNNGVIGILLGGSIAKGEEKENSDIDAMVILTDDSYNLYIINNKRAEVIFGNCTYEGGYFDIKYVNKDFLKKAAEFGSEPTRNSFIGVKCIYGKEESVDEIEKIIREIPVYPVNQKQDKILSFLSALILNAYFFWDEARKRNDIYLKTRVSAEIVLFGMRLILAHNNHLFPCQKWLFSEIEKVKNKPENIIRFASKFLEEPNDENKNIFVSKILDFTDWGIKPREEFGKICSRYIEDNELWWYNGNHNIVEW